MFCLCATHVVLSLMWVRLFHISCVPVHGLDLQKSAFPYRIIQRANKARLISNSSKAYSFLLSEFGGIQLLSSLMLLLESAEHGVKNRLWRCFTVWRTKQMWPNKKGGQRPEKQRDDCLTATCLKDQCVGLQTATNQIPLCSPSVQHSGPLSGVAGN